MPQDNHIGEIRSFSGFWFWISAATVCASMLLIGAFGAFVVLRGRDVNRDLCRNSAQVYTTVRDILETSEQQQLNLATTLAQIEQISRNTDELLALVPSVKCTSSGGPIELEP